MIEVITLPEPV